MDVGDMVILIDHDYDPDNSQKYGFKYFNKYYVVVIDKHIKEIEFEGFNIHEQYTQYSVARYNPEEKQWLHNWNNGIAPEDLILWKKRSKIEDYRQEITAAEVALKLEGKEVSYSMT